MEPTWELLSGTGEAGWYHPAALPQPTDPTPCPGGAHRAPTTHLVLPHLRNGGTKSHLCHHLGLWLLWG